MKGDIKKLLEKIRESDEETKKKWVVGASAVSMAIVIAFWLILSSSIVKSVDETANNNKNSDFWFIMKNGIGIAYESILKEISNITKKLNSANSITIERQN
jgi:hypothetical protein